MHSIQCARILDQPIAGTAKGDQTNGWPQPRWSTVVDPEGQRHSTRHGTKHQSLFGLKGRAAALEEQAATACAAALISPSQRATNGWSSAQPQEEAPPWPYEQQEAALCTAN